VSNASIVEHLEEMTNKLERGEISLSDFSEKIWPHMAALEALPKPLCEQGQDIVEAFLVLAAVEEDGVAVDAQPAVSRCRTWLASVPP
jgi:hypothetical protein